MVLAEDPCCNVVGWVKRRDGPSSTLQGRTQVGVRLPEKHVKLLQLRFLFLVCGQDERKVLMIGFT